MPFHFTGYRDYVRRAAVALGLDAPIIPGMAQVGGLVPLTRLSSLIGQMGAAPEAARAAIYAAARESEDALALAAVAAQAILRAGADAYGIEPPPPRLVPAAELAAALARVADLESRLAALAPGAKVVGAEPGGHTPPIAYLAGDEPEPNTDTPKGRKRPKG